MNQYPKFDICILCSSEPVSKAWEQILNSISVELKFKILKSFDLEVIKESKIICVDHTCNIHINNGQVWETDDLTDNLSEIIGKEGNIFAKIDFFRMGNLNDPCVVKFLSILYNYLDSKKIFSREDNQVTNIVNKYSLWHELKYGYNENVLKNLRAMGFVDKVEKYEKLWKKNPDEAKEYAKTEMAYAGKLRSSRVEGHHALIAESIPDGIPAKLVGVLLIDDNKDWYFKFLSIVDSFNRQNDEYEIELRYAQNDTEAIKAIEYGDLQAIILDFVLETGATAREGHGGKTAMELAKKIRELRPELPIYGMTGMMPNVTIDNRSEIASISGDWNVDRVFYKGESSECKELILAIIESVSKRSETPFFTALRKYSKRPTVVFHALPLSRAKSISGSQWVREFCETYGEGYFAGETSSTMPPLDSLFHPKYNLKLALDRAGNAFGADQTYFVTNGTTAANSIVYRSILKPGDIVILDRNCHRSHHYAAMQCGANVVYMEPTHIHEYGISSIVPLSTIKATVKACKGKAKMISITHPTFDGLLYDPKKIMKEVHEIDSNIVFLFDEAWFAYGMFHPEFRKFTTMHAARSLRNEGIKVRAYATQSIHKTLSALRQGSMIHRFDISSHPHLSQWALNMAHEEAFISLTSTSPNMHILASLDVARMQAEMEGFDCLSQALNIAKWIRSELKSGPVRTLEKENLATKEQLQHSEFELDPLKVTLHFDGVTGIHFREKELYERMGIQINKYSHNTVLVLVTIGTTWSMADHLIRSLKKWDPSSSSISELIESQPIPPFSEFSSNYKEEMAGNITKAYFASLQPDGLEEISEDQFEKGLNRAAANFITPYPPGYPILVPGQIINEQYIKYIRWLLAVGAEIHGLGPNNQLYVLK